ncbi:MAG: sugar ABC transporter ATP-binding protein [Chloroflexota bacterium]
MPSNEGAVDAHLTEASDDRPPVLEVEGVRKSYGDAVVLDDFDLVVGPGEVHALLGENGAGKSTLIKIIAGVVTPDRGRVLVAGKDLPFGSPQAALDDGVSTLFQELATVGGLSVAENIFLGKPTPSRWGVIKWGSLDRAAQELFASLGQSIDVTIDADQLTPVQKTMTALARALSQESPLVILDEPTAALTDAETTELFAAIRRLQADGVAILYVSHRLEEVFDIADRYTILRNGVEVARGHVRDTTVDAVIGAMAGRPIESVFPGWQAQTGPELLRVEELGGRNIHDASFELHAGEVVGIAGLAGSGRSELLRLIAGASARRTGHVWLDGQDFRPRSIGAAHRAGVVLVPQERRSQALTPDSVERNLNATTIDANAIASVMMSPARERAHAQRLWDAFDVRGQGLGQEVLTLSGGNQQKVVLAKFLALEPRVLLLDEPTRGVDVVTKSQIYGLIRDQAAAARAVLVVSSELLELIGLCNRIMVLHEGHLAGHYDATETTEEQLLNACYGRTM